MAESEGKLKSLLMRVKEKHKKTGLKLSIQKTKIMASSPITPWQIDGKKWKEWQILFSWASQSQWIVIAATTLKMLAPWKKGTLNIRQHIKKQRQNFVDKGPYSQGYGFSSSVNSCERWIIDKEGQGLKNWCFQRVVEKTLESPLDSKEVKSVNPKGSQLWISIGKTDADVEGPVLWPPDAKNKLIGKDSDTGKDGGQEEKGATENELVGRHHWPMNMSLSNVSETVKDREAWRAAVHGAAKSPTWLRDWTTTTKDWD